MRLAPAITAAVAIGVLGVLGVLTIGAVAWPPGVPGIKVIKIKYEEENGTCVPDEVGKTKATDLSRTNHDIFVLRIANDCEKPHTVNVVYNGVGLVCIGEPHDFTLNADFTIPKDEKAYLVCSVDYATTRGVKVTQKKQEQLRASEIGLDPVPNMVEPGVERSSPSPSLSLSPSPSANPEERQ